MYSRSVRRWMVTWIIIPDLHLKEKYLWSLCVLLTAATRRKQTQSAQEITRRVCLQFSWQWNFESFIVWPSRRRPVLSCLHSWLLIPFFLQAFWTQHRNAINKIWFNSYGTIRYKLGGMSYDVVWYILFTSSPMVNAPWQMVQPPSLVCGLNAGSAARFHSSTVCPSCGGAYDKILCATTGLRQIAFACCPCSVKETFLSGCASCTLDIASICPRYIWKASSSIYCVASASFKTVIGYCGWSQLWVEDDDLGFNAGRFESRALDGSLQKCLILRGHYHAGRVARMLRFILKWYSIYCNSVLSHLLYVLHKYRA